MSKSSSDEKSGSERRKAKRRSILEKFLLFAVVPKKGIHRLQIHDVSDLGLRFDLDIEGESPQAFPVSHGEVLGLRLYLNQSLYLPLDVKIVRIEVTENTRRIGGEFLNHDSKGYRGFKSLLGVLDELIDIAHIDPQ